MIALMDRNGDSKFSYFGENKEREKVRTSPAS